MCYTNGIIQSVSVKGIASPAVKFAVHCTVLELHCISSAEILSEGHLGTETIPGVETRKGST